MALLVNVNISSNQSFSLMNIFMYGLWTEPFSFISEGAILHFKQIAIKYTVVLKILLINLSSKKGKPEKLQMEKPD